MPALPAGRTTTTAQRADGSRGLVVVDLPEGRYRRLWEDTVSRLPADVISTLLRRPGFTFLIVTLAYSAPVGGRRPSDISNLPPNHEPVHVGMSPQLSQWLFNAFAQPGQAEVWGYSVAMLPERLDIMPDPHVRQSMAHELAHVWLGHEDDLGSDGRLTPDRRERHEREVLNQILAWGFVGVLRLPGTFGQKR